MDAILATAMLLDYQYQSKAAFVHIRRELDRQSQQVALHSCSLPSVLALVLLQDIAQIILVVLLSQGHVEARITVTA